MGHAATSAALSKVVLTQRINPTDLLIAASTAGALHKLTSSIPYLERASNAKIRTFGQQAAYHMTRAMVPSVVNVAYGRDVSFEDVMRMGVVSTVGAWGANEIGGRYLDKNTHYWGHKALHYGLGFGMAAALDPRNWVRAGLAGGTAAVVSEMLAEGLIGSPEDLMRNPVDPDSVKGQLFFSKAVGAIAGSLIVEGADPMAATLVARNAVENNYEHMMVLAQSTGDPDGLLESDREAREAVGKLYQDLRQEVIDAANLEQIKSWYREQYPERAHLLDLNMGGCGWGDVLSHATPGSITEIAALMAAGPIVGEAICIGQKALSRVSGIVAKYKPSWAWGGVTTHAAESGVVQKFESQFWKKADTHEFFGQSNKVYKRDDLIDLMRVDPDSGLTSLALMKKGRAPVGPDNLPINLHHTIQTQGGPLAELASSMHSKYHRVLHMLTNQSKGGVTRAGPTPKIDRGAFEKWKAQYWRERAIELTGGK